MPVMLHTPRSTSEPSNLMEGWHPAFLVYVAEEPTPTQWEWSKKSPLCWRWHFAVADSVTTMTTHIPEHQQAVSSAIFSGGKQASKAYTWACALVGHDIPVNEGIDTDAICPMACQVFVGRRDKQGQPILYANIEKVGHWAEGQALLTPEFRQKLATWWQMKSAGDEAPAPTPAAAPLPPVPAPLPTPTPARQAW